MRLHVHLVLGGLLVSATMSRPLGAQQRIVVDAGLSLVRFGEDATSVFGPSLHLMASGSQGPLFAAASTGGIATVGAASGFAVLEGGVRSPSRGGWSAEVAGELSSVIASNRAGGAGTSLASTRAIWTVGSGGVWLRGSGHVAARQNGALNGAGVDAGTWWSWSRSRLSASLLYENTSAQLFTGRFRTGYAGTTPVRYADANVSLHMEGDRASFDVSAGARRDEDAARLVEPTLIATAAFWQSDARAVVFSFAHQLPDWIRGADAADAASVGMRFRQPSPATDRASRLIPVVQVVDSAGMRVLRVRANGARQVDVMGDFTEWEARPLAPNGPVFERGVVLTSGSHRLMLRIDGGAWRPAANTPAVDDDFGGKAGLLVVP